MKKETPSMLTLKVTRRPSRKWLFLALTVGLAVALALSVALAGDAEASKKKKKKFRIIPAPVSLQNTVAQSGDPVGQANRARITGDTPYSFSEAQKFIKLNSVSATVSIEDGDTGDGELDRDHLHLVLDGIDTGIKLNDFTNSGISEPEPPAVTNTVSGDLAPDVADQILAKLKEDGELAATIVDVPPVNSPDFDEANPEIPFGNQVRLPSANQTTLKLDGTQLIRVRR